MHHIVATFSCRLFPPLPEQSEGESALSGIGKALLLWEVLLVPQDLNWQYETTFSPSKKLGGKR